MGQQEKGKMPTYSGAGVRPKGAGTKREMLVHTIFTYRLHHA